MTRWRGSVLLGALLLAHCAPAPRPLCAPPAVAVGVAGARATVRADVRVPLGQGRVLVLLDERAAAERISRRDDFVRALTARDRQLRVGVTTPVDEAAFLAHARAQVRPFTPVQVEKLTRIAEQVGHALAAQGLLRWLPPEIELVQTTGEEEGFRPDFDLSYTRAGVIYINTRALGILSRHLLLHELFHVLSATHEAEREALYATLGFEKVKQLDFGQRFEAERLTTPEVPRAQHGIRVLLDGASVLAVPVSAVAEGAPAGPMIDVETTRWAIVGADGAVGALVEPSALSQLREQVGYNTPGLAGPEELLADHFVLLVLGTTPVRSPELIERMRAVLVAP